MRLLRCRRLEGTLDEKRMTRLNAEAERTKNYTRAANLYFESGAGSGNTAGESFPQKLARWTLRHLQLAGFSLMLSVIFGIPLGIVASRGGAIGQAILGFASIVQTIPSHRFAGFACASSLFSESASARAIAGAFPLRIAAIVRNTASGLQDIPRSLRESAIALGLSPITRLWEIYLPMASRSILSGIKNQRRDQCRDRDTRALIGAGGLASRF